MRHQCFDDDRHRRTRLVGSHVDKLARAWAIDVRPTLWRAWLRLSSFMWFEFDDESIIARQRGTQVTARFMTLRTFCFVLLVAVPAASILPAPAFAGVVYVDNVNGNNAFDGLSSEPISNRSGPVRSITAGLARVRPGDRLVVTNHGVPYFESIQLVGGRFSGNFGWPFELIGNGAIVDGSYPAPGEAWSKYAGDVWKLKPLGKGTALLLRDGVPIPEFIVPANAAGVPEIPAGQWCVWKGAIYYHLQNHEEPREQDLSFAGHEVGLTLFQVRDVRVSGLTFRHFRLDGINAHDQCRGVLLENVVSTENGRSGLSVGGSASIRAVRCDFTRNRLEAIRLEELGAVDLNEVKVGSEPADPQE